MNSFIRFALGLANMPDETVASLEADLPGLSRLAAGAKELAPILKRLEPLAEQAAPDIELAIPILKRLYPDFMASLPMAEKLIEFIQK